MCMKTLMSITYKQASIETSKSVVAPDMKNKENIFYKTLIDKMNTTDREAFTINNQLFNLQLGNNLNDTTIYNTSGNLRIKCSLPKYSEAYPNYASVILKKSVVNGEIVNLMSVLLSFITDPDFITKYVYDEKLKAQNNVPNIDLRNALTNEEICLSGWNASRNFTKDNVPKISNYYIAKFNDLLDYVITNDLCTVDETFNKKFLSLFMSTDDKIYVHSNGTMVLPSLINWMATKRGDGLQIATDLCGYVEKDSKIFPCNKTDDWTKITKWSKNEEEYISPKVNVPKNINNGVQNRSLYNYPFDSDTQNITTVIDTPVESINYMQNVEPTFIEDRFLYDSTMNGVKYAKRDVGTDGTGPGKIWTNGTGKISVQIPSILKYMKESTEELYTKCENIVENKTKRGPKCNVFKTQTRGWVRGVYNKKDKLKVYTLTQTPEFIKAATDAVLNSTEFKSKYNNRSFYNANENPKISNVVPSTQGVSNTITFGEKCVKYDDRNTQVIKVVNMSQTLRFASCLNNEHRTVKVCEHSCENNDGEYRGGDDWDQPIPCQRNNIIKTAASAKHKVIPKDEVASYNVGFSVDYKTEATVQIRTGTYSTAYGHSSTDMINPPLDDASICMYTTLKKLYFFNDITFRYWMNIIKNTNNQQLVLNEIRKYVLENIELVMLNRVNKSFGEYARSFGQSTGFVGIPLGPPLVIIPGSYVVDYKYWFPTFTTDNTIDDSLISYDMTKSCNTVLNSISCMNSNNYLDSMFRSVINACRNLKGTFTADSVISIIIPTKGYQLFEVIDKSIVTIAPSESLIKTDKITDTTSAFHDFEMSKILIAFRDLSKDTKYATALTAYKFIASANIPMLNLTYNNDNIDMDLNTMSTSLDNKCYIYLSSDSTQEFVGTLKGNGADESDKNVDKNKVNNLYFNIQYNGIDSDKTPICLQLNFI